MEKLVLYSDEKKKKVEKVKVILLSYMFKKIAAIGFNVEELRSYWVQIANGGYLQRKVRKLRMG